MHLLNNSLVCFLVYKFRIAVFIDALEYFNRVLPLQDFTPNNPWFREVPNASANGFATARALAKLYGALARDGKLDGKVVLKGRAIIHLY